MTVFNLYVLGKGGQSLYYREWLREKDSQLSRSEEDKLMAGLVFSLSNFSRKMALQPDGATFKSLKVFMCQKFNEKINNKTSRLIY